MVLFTEIEEKTMQKALRFNATMTIQIDDTSQLRDFLKAVVMDALPRMENNPQLLLSSREAAKLLNISEKTLWTYYNSGRIRPIRCPSNSEWLEMKERWMKE